MRAVKHGASSVFFERVQKALIKRGFATLHELSKKVKISTGTIQGWKREGSYPQPKTLDKLAHELGVSRDWLLGATDQEPNWDVKPGETISDRSPEYCLIPKECRFASDQERNREGRLMSIWTHWRTMAGSNDPGEIDAQSKVIVGIVERYRDWLKTRLESAPGGVPAPPG